MFIFIYKPLPCMTLQLIRPLPAGNVENLWYVWHMKCRGFATVWWRQYGRSVRGASWGLEYFRMYLWGLSRRPKVATNPTVGDRRHRVAGRLTVLAG